MARKGAVSRKEFEDLQKKLEDMERQMKAGTWWPVYPVPQPAYQWNYQGPWPIPQITD